MECSKVIQIFRVHTYHERQLVLLADGADGIERGDVVRGVGDGLHVHGLGVDVDQSLDLRVGMEMVMVEAMTAEAGQ
jgi:hypothetical protein